jgi:hypothetical protein
LEEDVFTSTLGEVLDPFAAEDLFSHVGNLLKSNIQDDFAAWKCKPLPSNL